MSAGRIISAAVCLSLSLALQLQAEGKPFEPNSTCAMNVAFLQPNLVTIASAYECYNSIPLDKAASVQTINALRASIEMAYVFVHTATNATDSFPLYNPENIPIYQGPREGQVSCIDYCTLPIIWPLYCHGSTRIGGCDQFGWH